MRERLIHYIQFNNWANERIFTFAERLSPVELGGKTMTDRTAFVTMQHMVVAEALWRATCEGQSPAALIEEIEATTDLASLKVLWEAEVRRMMDFITPLAEDGFERVVTAAHSGLSYKIGDLILHIVGHSNIHRNELGWYFTSFGHSPGDMDYLDFIEITSPPEEP